MSNYIITDFNKSEGIQLKWKKIYTSMLRILMKHVLYLNQIIQLRSTNLKIKTI